MRLLKRTVVHSMYLLVATTAAAQENQDYRPHLSTSTQPLSGRKIESLALIGKVWGYLKYNHPSIASGCTDWDSKLISELQALVDMDESSQIRIRLSELTRNLEEEVCSNGVQRELQAQPNTDWIRDGNLLGAELSELLRSVENLPRAGSQFYVAHRPGVGNPIFENERIYEEDTILDWRFRILALYRFWNIIEYWYPYRNLIPDQWDQVLIGFLPRFYSANTKDEFGKVLTELVARVDDGHATLQGSDKYRPPLGTYTVPFAIRIVEDSPFVWRSSIEVQPNESMENSLHVGDVILAVDQQPVSNIIRDRWPYYGASNETAKMRRIFQSILNGASESVMVTIDRDGTSRQLKVGRIAKGGIPNRLAYFHDLSGDTFRFVTPDIAYLKLSTIKASDIPKYIDQLNEIDGLIVDIRNYPAEFVVFALGQHLVREETEFVRFTVGDPANPGAFYWTDPITIKPNGQYYPGHVAILVDDSTISQAEYTAMGLRAAPNSFVVGSTTAGADGNVSRIPLPGGHFAAMSGIGVFYPDKTETQQVGIVPDIVIRPTIKALRIGKDEVLEAAIGEIRTRSKNDSS